MAARVESLRDQVEHDLEERKWGGEPVYECAGTPEEILAGLPEFERQPFSLGEASFSAGDTYAFHPVGVNKLWDMVVRLPLARAEAPTPVAIVSKHYALIQHRDLFVQIHHALSTAGLDKGTSKTELALSAYGTKMALRFTFPEKYSFDPGDQSPVALQLHCVNSVDGKARLCIMLGWFRFVCSNGLVVGTSQISRRLIHNDFIQLPDLEKVLSDGIALAERDKKEFSKWFKTPVAESQLPKWIDGPVKEMWGPLAAARTYLICRTGFDGRFARPFENAPPHSKQMEVTRHVPGAPATARNAYHVCQALAWIAKERKDIQAQLDGMRQLPKLMGALLS